MIKSNTLDAVTTEINRLQKKIEELCLEVSILEKENPPTLQKHTHDDKIEKLNSEIRLLRNTKSQLTIKKESFLPH